MSLQKFIHKNPVYLLLQLKRHLGVTSRAASSTEIFMRFIQGVLQLSIQSQSILLKVLLLTESSVLV